MIAVNERPILFSAPMVRSILAGHKTVTRRPVRHQPDVPVTDAIPRRNFPHGPATIDWYWRPKHGHLNGMPSAGWDFKCPFGQPGEHLWVRESHAQVFEVDIPVGRPFGPVGTTGSPGRPDWKSRYVYRADGEMPNVQWHHVGDNQPVRWTPSIHMPRIASRILLEITDIRIERLHDISEDHAIAEGVDVSVCQQFLETSPTRHQCKMAAIHGFSGLWESINGAGTWDSNPWVWVVIFKRVAL